MPLRIAAFVALALFAYADGARADDSLRFEHAYSACGNPCRIGANVGGKENFALQAALEVHAGKKGIAHIVSLCFSACVGFAAYGRPYVCVEPGAKFWVHRSLEGPPPTMAEDIKSYVVNKFHLGSWDNLPPTSTLLEVPKTFWPPC